MSGVNRIKAFFAFAGALIFGGSYVVLRSSDVLPDMLFPTTSKLVTVELYGLLLLVPALLLFCRGLAWVSQLGFIGTLKRRIRAIDERLFVALAMVFVFGVSLLLLVYVLGGVPHVQDSIVLIFQARIFAMGEVGVPPPEHLEFFRYPFLTVENGLLHAKYLPIHSLILALGLLLNAEFLLQPILAALSLLLIYLLARELYGQMTAKAAALLVSISPFFLYMHTSFLSHTTALLFFTLFMLSLVKSLKSPRIFFPVLAGLSLGLMFNTRPQTAYIMALALIPFVLKELIEQKKRVRSLSLFALGLLPAGALTLLYRYPFTGKLLGLPFDFSNPTDRLGFHPDVGDLYGSFGHTPLKAWYNFSKNFYEMNSNLFGFPMVSLLFFFLVFLSRRKDRWERAFVAVPIGLVFFHIFYWVDGVCFGARYWFSCLPLFVILTVRGISRLGRVMGPGRAGARAAVLFVILLVLVSAFDYHPRRAALLGSNYWSVNTKVSDAVKRLGIHDAIILMDTEDDPLSYSAGYLNNSPTFDDRVLYAIDMGRERDRLLFEAYPDRAFFICSYGTTTDREPIFEMIHPLPSNPLPPEDVIRMLDRGFYLASLQRFDEAADIFSWAIFSAPEMATDFLPLDDEFFIQNIYPRLRVFRPISYLISGVRFFDARELELSREAMEAAVRISPHMVCPRLPIDDPAFRLDVLDRLDIRGDDSLTFLARTCCQYSQYDRATEYVRRSISIYEASFERLMQLAYALFRARRYEEAIETCDRLARIQPDDPSVDLLRGRILSRVGQTERAEEALRRALPRQPVTTDLWTAMGDYAVATSDMNKAKKSFQVALANDEINIDASMGLAQVLLLKGDIEGAQKTLDRIEPVIPDSRELNNLLGVVHYLKHEPSLAIEHLSRALRLSDRGVFEWDELPVLQAHPQSEEILKNIEKMIYGNQEG
ncbi:MAG: tetratricopeptide repeat protein [Candidatus Coatesbacteria bacterium]|nr:tetratricopeptide repeat protein [Candidatus Coatesbacteria bacterium]